LYKSLDPSIKTASLLLSALGISDQILLEIQQEHFSRLHRCLDDRLAAFEILSGNSKLDEAEELTQLDEEDPIPSNLLNVLQHYRKTPFLGYTGLYKFFGSVFKKIFWVILGCGNL